MKDSASEERIGFGSPGAFDLQARARLALNCLTRLLDLERGYQPYFGLHFATRPPTAHHSLWDYGDGAGRILDAVALARNMTGSNLNSEVDSHLRRFLFSLLGSDGLTWWPDSPWTGETAAEMFSQRSTLMGLVTLYQACGDEEALDRARRMVQGLWRIAKRGDGYIFYPGDRLYKDGWRNEAEPLDSGEAAWFGVQVFSLMRYYEVTGDELAVELGNGLANFLILRARDFNPDGSFNRLEGRNAHYHSRTATIAGILKLGQTTGDKQQVSWAQRAYERAKDWASSFGWSPENLNNLERCETCNITDLVEIAIMLARSGQHLYWEEAERFGANHLLESQLLRTDWIESLAPQRLTEEEAAGACQEAVLERALGGFAGWSAPNDWIHPSVPRMMACCNAAGTRALYDLWHHTLTVQDNALFVNLYFTRSSSWADVISHLPAEGRVEVLVHRDLELFIRKPEAISLQSISAEVNGRCRQRILQEGFLQIGRCAAGDKASVTFPLEPTQRTEKIGEKEYTTTWRGNFVTEIHPAGDICPLYLHRDQVHRQNARYSPPEEIASL